MATMDEGVLPQRVHHINFVVHDLEQAISRYEVILGRPVAHRESLPGRGKLARFEMDGVWIVLVQPVDENSPPGQHLAEHGEGFFLLSFEVADLETAADRLKQHDIRLLNEKPRQGLENWQVMDLDPRDACGVLVQLVEEKATPA